MIPPANSETRDMRAFRSELRAISSRSGALPGFFQPGVPVSVARAPGRLDVMGGIADYSGSLVLQLPIREATWAAAQWLDDGVWRFASVPEGDGASARQVIISAGDVRRLLAGDYQAARRWFRQGDGIAWAAYVAGVVLVLAAECGADGQRGLRLLVRSAVPEGKGVSSSAALEVAAFQAARLGQNIQVSGTEAARLCQLAENLVVGAPCGIMDQMTSALGQASQLLALLCQPAEVQGFVEVPDSIRVWGIDSGIRHAVSGSDYGSVRTGAFMGYRMIAEQAGWRASPTAEDGVVHIEDPQCRGYLANLLPEDFASLFAGHLPETIRGDDFLRHYGGTTDRVTRVDPHRAYAVRQPAAHPVYEHARVAAFRRLLTSELNDTVLVEMGEMMYASHASYSACGLGSAGTDRLVEKVRQAGTASGMFGAKITGGGSGGTVAVLGRADAAERVFQVAEEYGRETDRRAYVFSGSSPGAYAFGVHCVEAW